MSEIKEKLRRGINPPYMLQSMASGYRREALAEIERLETVIDALRAELAKYELEPVAIYRFSHLLGEYGVKWLITSELPDGTLLYTKEQLWPEPVAIYRFSHLLGEYGVKWLITSELPDGTLLYTKEQL